MIRGHVLFLLCALCFVSSATSAYAVWDEPKNSTVRITVTDASSDQLTPARIQVTDRGGESFIAKDALPIGGECLSFFKDTAPMRTSFDEALSKFKNTTVNSYTKKINFYSTGVSELSLPPGKYRIIITKGPEFYTFTEKVRVADGQPIEINAELKRMINMPERGWYSGDDHLHIERTHKDIDPIVLKQMMAEDIHIGNTLQMGRAHSFSVTPQYAHGEESHYQEGDYLIATGQENLRTHLLGHTISLGADRPLGERDSYLNYPKFWKMAIEQGGINGIAHFGALNEVTDAGAALYSHHHLLHFMEVLQFNRAEYSVWYDLLNLGFRISPTAGTDYPCVNQNIPGKERMFAHIEGKLTYKKWLEAVEKGRTFLSNGPLLSFEINNLGVGNELQIKSGQETEIYGAVTYDPKRDYVKSLELMQNGSVVYEFPNPGKGGHFEFKIRPNVNETSWFALRTSHPAGIEFNPLRAAVGKHRTGAHTAAIYVTVEDGPTLKEHSRASDIAKSWIAVLGRLEILLNDENIERTARIGAKRLGDPVPEDVLINSRDELMREIGEAEKFFSQYVHH